MFCLPTDPGVMLNRIRAVLALTVVLLFVLAAVLVRNGSQTPQNAAHGVQNPGPVSSTTTAPTVAPEPPTTLAPVPDTTPQTQAPQIASQPVSAPVQPAAGPAPCYAPDIALSWVAWCESGCNPTNHNRYSSAAGKYQYLDTTWNDFGGYTTADVAPEYVQDQRALQDEQNHGLGAWSSSQGCWGGKF